jgi:hypothetical protein
VALSRWRVDALETESEWLILERLRPLKKIKSVSLRIADFHVQRATRRLLVSPSTLPHIASCTHTKAGESEEIAPHRSRATTLKGLGITDMQAVLLVKARTAHNQIAERRSKYSILSGRAFGS